MKERLCRMICKVCKRRFSPNKDSKYLAKKETSVIDLGPKTIFECFDCPKCGCQNIVNIRESNYEVISTSN